MKSIKTAVIVCLVTLLTACGGGSKTPVGVNTNASYPVQVSVTGLAAGTELLLETPGMELFHVTANGTFTARIPSYLSNGYAFSVYKHPAGEVCTVSNGTGNGFSFSTPVSVACIVPPALNPTTEVTTFSGSGINGYLDGSGTVARFSDPTGIAVDTAGNVYVSDNNAIRKITPSGAVSTLAGSGRSGRSNGTGPAASFNSPGGLAIDSTGNIYVADTGNNLIRKVTSTGQVTTIAGTGYPGTADGPALQATFDGPRDVKLDSQGNIHVAEYYSIRKISAAGIVTTTSPFSASAGLGVDSKGNIYVGLVGQYPEIVKLAPDGVSSTLAGGGPLGNTDGVGAYATFYAPNYFAVDANDNIYVSEKHDVRVMTPLGVVSTYAGAGALSPGWTDGPGTVAAFSDPAGIAFDAAGNLYVADYGNKVIRVIKAVSIN